jgi:toxin-antitoxin system PIN domain toxin
LDDRLNGRARLGLPWSSSLAFLRLVTNPRIFARPEPVESAWQQVEEWLECESVWIPEPSDRYREILAELIAQVSPTGNLIPDTHLAALAIDHGCGLASTDGDFGRFPGLRWENPIAGTQSGS